MENIALVIAANLCGVAAMYVVIWRTIQRQKANNSDAADNASFDAAKTDRADKKAA